MQTTIPILNTSIIFIKKTMRKKQDNFVELSRYQFYLLLQSIFISIVLLYQLIWFFAGNTTIADCIVYGRKNELKNSGTIAYRFITNNKLYEDYDTRNEAVILNDQIEIVYLSFLPSFSRINSFKNNWLGYIIAYGLFCTFTSLLFFIPNDTMPAGTYFYFTKKKPWVNMIEK
jgi:hypothetical protein